MRHPRGIRNNNPGNIERNTIRWQGMAEDQSSDSRFVVFTEPKWGIRAIARILLNYERRGLNTVRKLIDRWAPPVENDTDAYVQQVADACGVHPDEPIDVQAYLRFLVPAIIRHENGQQPYTPEQIHIGISLA